MKTELRKTCKHCTEASSSEKWNTLLRGKKVIGYQCPKCGKLSNYREGEVVLNEEHTRAGRAFRADFGADPKFVYRWPWSDILSKEAIEMANAIEEAALEVKRTLFYGDWQEVGTRPTRKPKPKKLPGGNDGEDTK